MVYAGIVSLLLTILVGCHESKLLQSQPPQQAIVRLEEACEPKISFLDDAASFEEYCARILSLSSVQVHENTLPAQSQFFSNTTGDTLITLLKNIYWWGGGLTLTPDIMLYLMVRRLAVQIKSGHMFVDEPLPVLYRNGSLKSSISDAAVSLSPEIVALLQTVPVPMFSTAQRSLSLVMDSIAYANTRYFAPKSYKLPSIFVPEGIIAHIALQGTLQDWMSLRTYVMNLAEHIADQKDLIMQFVSIVDHCIDAYDQRKELDVDFWQQMFRYNEEDYKNPAGGWLVMLCGGQVLAPTIIPLTQQADSTQDEGRSWLIAGVLSFVHRVDGYYEPQLGYVVVSE